MNINKGILFAFLTALISGFAVFLNKFAVSLWANPSVFTTAKNLIATVFLVSLFVLFKKLPELSTLSWKRWISLLVIGFIGGSLPFLLFFKGLSLSSAANAAFIHKTLFIWVVFLAVPLLKEKISALQFLSLGVILAGVYLFGSPSKLQFGYGEFLVLLATFCWAIENIIAKHVLKNTSALLVGAGRMFFGSIFLLGYLFLAGDFNQLFVFTADKLGWLILSGVVLFGYVTVWYSALKLAPATVVSSILVVAAPLTALLDFIFVTHGFKGSLILPIFLMATGILFFINFPQKFIVFLKKKQLIWQDC